MAEANILKFSTKNCGEVSIKIQGSRSANEVVIFTIHDLGCDFNQYQTFLNHESMQQIVARSVFIHMCIPGQSENDPDLERSFPTMQEISEDIIDIFDNLKIDNAVLFGEGAGANILARFALNHSDRVYGCVLIHCTGSTAGFTENIQRKLSGWKLKQTGMNQNTESFLVVHRFGAINDAKTEEEFRSIVTDFKNNLKYSINPKNLNKFISSYINRTNISEKIGELKCRSLFITGSLANQNGPVLAFYDNLQRQIKDPAKKAEHELMQIDNVANVLAESPEKVADALQFFMQGLGLLCGIRPRNSIEPPSSRRISMEQLDLPRGPDALSSARKISLPLSAE